MLRTDLCFRNIQILKWWHANGSFLDALQEHSKKPDQNKTGPTRLYFVYPALLTAIYQRAKFSHHIQARQDTSVAGWTPALRGDKHPSFSDDRKMRSANRQAALSSKQASKQASMLDKNHDKRASMTSEQTWLAVPFHNLKLYSFYNSAPVG
jgi:hypothetical protein